MIPGYVKKETSTFGDEKLRIAPHKGTTDTVKSAMDKFKRQKQAAEERKKNQYDNIFIKGDAISRAPN